jgi:mannan endo-1,4-beta-mannosidase
MNNLIKIIGLLLSVIWFQEAFSQKAMVPVNPNATEEARNLLKFLYQIKGKYVVAGHHNYAENLNQYSIRAQELTGKMPALWGTDFISTNPEIRQQLVDEAIEKFRQGYIITLMWHAGRPQDEPPYGWKESVQAEVTEAEWKDITTTGTDLYKEWMKDADEVAGYLKQLRDAGVPVLWRPYHEMNGIWFWWGDKPGPNGYQQLWKNMYNRFTNHHNLNNLIWVWNANGPRDRENDEAYAYENYFPGLDYVDVLATDIYHNDYKQSHHDKLIDLAGGKPVALGEIGEVPAAEILDQQADWVWFMIWSRWIDTHNTPEKVKALYLHPKVITKDELKLKKGKYGASPKK